MIFVNYELGNKLYKDEFDKLSFKRDQFNGSLRFTQKYFFNHDLEKARYILTKIIKDIDTYGVEFIEVEGKVKEKVVYKTKPKSMKCFLIDTPICNKDIIEQPSWVFQAYDYKNKNVQKAIIEGINPILSKYNLIPKPAKDLKKRHDYMCKICQMIQESKYFIADLSNDNTNVGLELGLALGIGKEVILFTSRDPNEVSDLKRTELIIYDIDKIDRLKLDFTETLRDVIKR